MEDNELLNHLTLMREEKADAINSLTKRIPKYQAEYEEDHYPETLTMIGRLEERLARTHLDFDALTQAIRLVESQIP